MKRIAMLAAALAVGCVSEAPPPVYGYGDVIVYWNFSRYTTAGAVLYDANLSPGGGSGACADSGVEYVTVTDLGGNLIDPYTPTIPCVYLGVQGATFLTFLEGNYTFVVHGYRTVAAVPVEVHHGQGSLYVYPYTQSPVTVTAAGLPGALDVFLYEGISPLACFVGDTLGYTLVDGLGTTLDQVSGLACNDVISFSGVDLDNLDIRVQVSDATGVVLDSCVSQPFDHFANDTGSFGWAVGLQTLPCP